MSWNTEAPNFTANIVGMDSRADWLLQDSRADYQSVSRPPVEKYVQPSELLIPFVVRIKEQAPSQIVGQLVEADLIYVSGRYLTETSTAKDGNKVQHPKPGELFVAYATLDFFKRLAQLKSDSTDLPDLEALRIAEKEIQLRTPLLFAQPDWNPPGDEFLRRNNIDLNRLDLPKPGKSRWPEGTVIMAIIDDGMAVANSHFQNNSGTRVEYFWRQGGPNTSTTVEHGLELTKSEIDGFVNDSIHAGVLDEDEFYQRSNLVYFSEPGTVQQTVTQRASHGTHIMDIAAGYEKEKDVQDRPIIAVQLPSRVVENTSGHELDNYVIDAIKYILERATQISPDQELPIVINLSFGRYSGPHDGSSEIEKHFDSIIASRENTRIILPAGNSRQSRTHSKLTKADFNSPEKRVELNCRLLPDDKTHSYIHMWLSADIDYNPPTKDRFLISVITPTGVESPLLGEHAISGDLVYTVNGRIVCRVRSSFEDFETKRTHITITMMPTARDTNIEPGIATEPVIQAGIWKIVIRDVGLSKSTEIDCWIERDDTSFGYRPRGRQSYFDDVQYERYDDTFTPYREDSPSSASTTKRTGTLNGIATGEATIVVGAMYGKERTPTDYSSCGPGSKPFGQPDPFREGPDFLVTADDSRVHVGIPGAGTRSGSVVYLNGTSVAAPRVARKVADMLAAGDIANRMTLNALVEGNELLGGSIATKPSKECGGSGRWDLNHPHSPPSRFE